MFGNLGKMMKVAAEIKTRLPQLKQRLEACEYSAVGGAGSAVATVNGRMQLVDLKIDQAVLAEAAEDTEMLADLIKAAVSAAQTQAAAAAEEAMKELTGGMDLEGLGDLL